LNRLSGLVGCEQECMDACSYANEFESYNVCVEECMFQCLTVREKPASLKLGPPLT
jgi:hypothetical protein